MHRIALDSNSYRPIFWNHSHTNAFFDVLFLAPFLVCFRKKKKKTKKKIQKQTKEKKNSITNPKRETVPNRGQSEKTHVQLRITVISWPLNESCVFYLKVHKVLSLLTTILCVVTAVYCKFSAIDLSNFYSLLTRRRSFSLMTLEQVKIRSGTRKCATNWTRMNQGYPHAQTYVWFY